MKYNKSIGMILIMVILSTIIIGCTNKSTNGNEESNTTLNLDYNMDKKSMKDEEIDISDFNLGEGTIMDPNGREVGYQIRGTMAVPKAQGKYPVVIIGHGSHANVASNRFDNGFSYLVEAVAKQGYVALSMDIQMQFSLDRGEPQWIERLDAIYREHISKLKQANNGEDIGYKVNLSGKVDLDNQIFIGHSRSGQDMLLLAERLQKQGDNSIKGMISIAPSQVFHVSKEEKDGIPPSTEFYADIPIGFIVPEYDGDVSSLDGFTMYDKILKEDSNRKSSMSLVLLKGGKHNFFNTLLKEDTMFLDQDMVIINKLNEEQHRDFIVNYTVDFLNAIIKNEPKDTVFDINSPAPNKMYGYNVITKLHMPNTKSVDLIDIKNPNLNTQDVESESTLEHWIPKNDKIGAFRDPRISDPINLLSLTWNTKGSIATIDVSENSDFSKYTALSMQLAPNPTNQANKADVNQGFTLVIKDKKGKESKVVVGQENTLLSYIPGKIHSDDTVQYYSSYTPIGELRIPIEYLKGVDLTNITNISLVFDHTDSGNIVIEEINLIQMLN